MCPIPRRIPASISRFNDRPAVAPRRHQVLGGRRSRFLPATAERPP